MKITRVRLTNYRGIDTLEVRLPRRGLCVLLGDNEIGKSSVVEAIDLLLDYPHDSRSQAVVAVKPVHRDVGAEVEIDVETGDCMFTYRKRFHVAPRTELIVHAPQRENRTGREAHERVRALLRERVDLDLWRALRVPQGSIGEQPSLAAAPSLARVLAEDAERQTHAHDDLLASVRREYERYFTPTGERRRALADEAAELARRRREVEVLETAVAEVELDAERVAALDDAVARETAAEDAAATALAATTRERHAAEALAQELALAQQTLAAAEPALRSCESAIRLLRERERLQPAAADATARAAASAAHHASTQEQMSTAQQRHTAMVERRDHAHRRVAQRAAAEKLDTCRRAHADWQALQAQAQTEPPLAPAEVEHMARLQTTLGEARARLAAQTAAVHVHAKQDISIESDSGDGGVKQVHLRADDRQQHTVHAHLRLDLPQVTIEVRAGSGAADLMVAAREAEAALQAACRQARVESVDAARQRLGEQRERDRAARELAGVLGRLLPVREPAQFAAAIERLAKATAAAAPDADIDPGELAAADADLEATIALLRATQRAELDARAAAQRDADALAAVTARLQAVDAALATLAEAGTAVGSLAAAARALDAAAARHAQARLQLGRLQACSSRTLAMIDADLTRLQQAEHAARAAARQAREQLTALQTRLVLRGDEGLAERLGRADADLQQAAQTYAQKERAAAAAKALHDALLRARDDCVQTYHAPIENGIEALGRAVFGASFQVALDERLQVTSRTLDGVTVAFKDLSLGAREQIAILVRLACAMAVAPQGGVPVWLDDALGQSDPDRLRGMGTALQLAGERCQVVLLTCSPQRSQWPGAQVVRLRPHGAADYGREAAS